jgi:hypothetical protein
VNVRWKLPDGTVREQPVPDLERLLFVLRMVGGIRMENATYRIAGSVLEVSPDDMFLLVNLE